MADTTRLTPRAGAPEKGGARSREVIRSEDLLIKKSAFLRALCKSCNVTLAARAAKVERRTPYTWRKDDAEFAEAWDEAVDIGVDALELEARRRALQGVIRPVFQKGEKVGVVREYSDTLMMFLLKSHRPEKFNDRFTVDPGKGGVISFTMNLGTPPDNGPGESDGGET